MKKIIAITLMLIVALSCISCSTKTAYTVLEVGDYDYVSDADHVSEYTLKDQTVVEPKMFNEREISFNGETHAYTYDRTKKGYLYGSDVERYKIEEDRWFIELGVNQQTGIIDFFQSADMDYLKQDGLVEKSKEECLRIATDYLSAYVEDAGTYDLIKERYVEIPEYDAIYSLVFARVIDGVTTSDQALISITIYGDIVTHKFTSLGQMKGVDLPNLEVMTAIQADVDQKLENIYASVKKDSSVSYDLSDMVFVRLSNGKYALEYYYDVQIDLPDGSDRMVYETTHIIAILE